MTKTSALTSRLHDHGAHALWVDGRRLLHGRLGLRWLLHERPSRPQQGGRHLCLLLSLGLDAHRPAAALARHTLQSAHGVGANSLLAHAGVGDGTRHRLL